MKATNIRVLPRSQEILPAGVQADMQVWRERNPHALRARFRRAERREEVALVRDIAGPSHYGQYYMVVKVLKAPRRVAGLSGWGALGLVLAAGGTVGLGVMIYASRYALGALALLAVLLWIMARSASGHRAICAGLHCPGCRG